MGLGNKVVSRNVALGLAVLCVISIAGLAGVYWNYSSIISGKDSSIATLNSQITTLQNQVNALPKNSTAFIVSQVPNMALTLIGANGQQKVLAAKDIAALGSYTGAGGFKSKSGTISGVGNWTGVPVLTLCKLVGGILSNQSIKVTGSDNFTATFTYQKIVGEAINTYNPVTGASQNTTLPITMIASYYYNGAKLSSSDGPLRTAFIGYEGLLTDGSNGAKLIVKIEILN